MQRLTGKTRIAFLIFFISHIPFTLLIDSQAVLPPHLVPQFMQRFLEWYTQTHHDNLMAPPHELFLKSFVSCELIFQLPFFFIASYVLMNSGTSSDGNNKVDGKGWFRTACLVYGSHTATTLVPILATFYFDDDINSMERFVLFSFYLPYLIFPLWLVAIAATSDDVFGDDGKSTISTPSRTKTA